VAVLAGGDTVRAVLRSAETDFQADHFTATLAYDDPGIAPGERRRTPDELVPLDVDRELYDGVLFQNGRFRRLLRYRRLHAYGCVADVALRPSADWFGAFQPGELVLADPGARDAVMHALQACVPDATLLPTGIDRLVPAGPRVLSGVAEVVVHAREREHAGETYVWDAEVCTPDGAVVERWEGLRLTAVLRRDRPWAPALLGTYLERRARGPLLPTGLRLAVRRSAGTGWRAATAATVRQILGPDATLRHRPDGRPELGDGRYVSATHTGSLTMAVVGDVPVACDAEAVVPRAAEDWAALLGTDGLALARFLGPGDLDTAGTRVWTAIECLRKAGHATARPTAGAPRGDGWVVLHAGSARIASFVTAVHGQPQPLAVALLADAGE
jgi:enediyne polyketide synthase